MLTPFLKAKNLAITALVLAFFPCSISALDIAITIDDFPMGDGARFTLNERTERFIQTLKKHELKVCMFCIGSMIQSKKPFKLLDDLDKAGHYLAYHSMNHDHFSKLDPFALKHDIEEMNKLLSSYTNTKKWFRFPYLDYGNRTNLGGSLDKMKSYLTTLNKESFKEGYVTINTFDWYINSKLHDAIKQNLKINYQALETVYLKLMKQWITFYIDLYKKNFPNEPIKHTLLLHANDLNTLYMDQIINMIKQEGFKLVDPQEVFENTLWRQKVIEKPDMMTIMAPTMNQKSCDEALKECFSVTKSCDNDPVY